MTRSGGAFSFPLIAGSGTGCDAGHLCSWNGTNVATATVNRAQDTVQAFYFANRFHDHLAPRRSASTPPRARSRAPTGCS